MENYENIRGRFPFYQSGNAGEHIIYLDNGATTQKPFEVIEALTKYNTNAHANIHRGAYQLSIEATKWYERVREEVQAFMGASRSDEIIYTKGTTEGINLIASAFGENFLENGDEVVLGITEHHSNILPWQRLVAKKQGTLSYLRTTYEGLITEAEIEKVITAKTKIVAIGHISNVLGVIHPIDKIIRRAHEVGAVVVVDGAQSIAHESIDVTALDADFYVFSGHKMFGPTGIGIVYGKYKWLEQMTPYQLGGDMIEYVTEQDYTMAPIPQRFEAGTPNIEGVVGLGAAIEFIEKIGKDKIKAFEWALTQYALEALEGVEHITVYGPDRQTLRGPVISFNVEDVHPHDVASILDHYNIAVRAGHHCAQPLMKYLGIPATCRASFSIYNTKQDVDQWIAQLKTVRRWLGYEPK